MSFLNDQLLSLLLETGSRPAGAPRLKRISLAAALAAGLFVTLLFPSSPAHAVCATVIGGQIIDCGGATAGSQTFTATAQPWTYVLTDSGGTFGTTITGTAGSSTSVGVVGITNNGDFNGTVTVNANTAIVNNASGARPGLVIENSSPSDSTVSVIVNGKIQTNDGNADAIRLVNGYNYTVTIGSTGLVHGGDDGIVVTAATGLVTITNNGTVEVTGTSGSGTNLSDGVLIASGGTPGSHISGAATVTNSGTVSGFTAGDPENGGAGLSVSANGAINITNSADGNLNAANAGGNYGIFAHGSSTVDITNAGDIGVTGGHLTISGISATNTTAAMNITNSGEIGSSSNRVNGTGINAVSGSGAVTVSNTSNSIWSVGDGIHATSTANVIVNNGDGATPNPNGLINSSAGNGISAQSTAGSVTVNTGTNSSISAGLRGITVQAATTATINNLGSVAGGTGTSGNPVIYSSATNGLTLNNCTQALFDLDGCSGAVIGSSLGSPNDDMVLLATGGAVATTNINNYGTINGRMDLSGGGAVVFNNYSENSWNTSGTTNFSADIDLVDNNGGTINTTGSSATVNFLDGNDKVLNRNGGTINTAGITSLRFGSGEDAFENTGHYSSVNTSGLTTFIFDNANLFLGFPISNSGTQYNDSFKNTRGATFDANGTTTFWFGGGNDVFENTRGASFYGDGITTINLGSGDDFFTNEKGGLFDVDGVTTLAFGSGTDELLNRWGGEFFADGISLTITGLETLTNTSGGTIELSALANTVTGLTTLTNTRGGDFAADGLVNTFSFGSGNDTFANDRGGRFEVSHLSTFLFLGGDDTFSNTRGGRFVSDGLTTFAFGSGAYDTVNNASGGRISASGLLTFSGLEFFNNGSEWGRGTLDMENGQTGDVIAILPGDGNSLQFNGLEGQSRLKIDAYLGGPEDDWADLLVIGGEVLGRTQVSVTNLYEGLGMHDPVGVKVIQADASSGDGGEFFLTGPVKSGLFDYGLFFDNSGETDDWYLRSDVNGAGANLGSVQTGLTTLFTESAGTWNQRTTELRDAFNDVTGSTVGTHGSVSLPPTNGPGHGAWLVAFGGAQNRSATFTTMIDTYDGSYRQTALGLLGGIDTAVDVEGEGTLLAGFLAGYMSSGLNFATEGTTGTMQGGSVGGYLTYLNGGLFVDLLVKADFVSLAYTSGGSTANTSGRAIGAIADIGYRVDSGQMFFEPLATLAYVNTTTGGFELLGTNIVFPNGNNLLARAGIRIGGNGLSTATERVETYVTASVWNDFLNGSAATIESGGDEVTVANLGSGLYFEVGAGLEIASLVNGVSGFLRGDVQFSETLNGGTGRAGVRVNW